MKFELRNIEPDRYSYIDLLSDVCENVLNCISSGQNFMIALCCDIPGTVETMNIETDSDVLEMFGLHRRNGYINVYVRQVHDDV